MVSRAIIFAGFLFGSTLFGYGTSGLYGHTFNGSVDVTIFYDTSFTTPQNVSNLGSPLAIAGEGTEFAADFDDVFSQHWHLTADFLDNYQLVLMETSPTTQANIGGSPALVQWHFYGFDFPIGEVREVSGPGDPWESTILSYSSSDVVIGFNHLYEVPSQGTYVFEIAPAVPEPAALSLMTVGSAWWIISLRKRA